ncbi:uncharacterized protein TNCV_4763951, partial [Trichonephila clavipes]
RKSRREESVTPTTSCYNLRPRSGKRVESRPTIERKTLQGGPVQSRKGRGRNDSPYIEERTRSNNRNVRRGGDQQWQERKGACTRKSLSLAVLHKYLEIYFTTRSKFNLACERESEREWLMPGVFGVFVYVCSSGIGSVSPNRGASPFILRLFTQKS